MQQSQQIRKKEDQKRQPGAGKVIERNIRTIIHLRTKARMNAACKAASPTPLPPFRDG